MIFDNKISISEEAMYSKDNKNPVFIVLSSGSSLFAKGIKTVTRSEFSHAMISFNSKLDPLYSFGTKAGGKGLGFVINNPKDYVFDVEDAKYSVYVMYVTDKAKKAMQDALQFFIYNKNKLKYDFHGILDIWVGKSSDQRKEKWFCSRFVMFLISKATELSKVPSLWKPGDIEKLDNISLVNRGFNFYNYNYKVTERHCNDIKKGTYNAGDVLYEDASSQSIVYFTREITPESDEVDSMLGFVTEADSDEYINYITTGSESYLNNRYKRIYKSYYYKIPKVGFPSIDVNIRNEIIRAAKAEASSYYKYNVSDASRDYPFKFFNTLDISKQEYMNIINNNVPISKRYSANLYHVNIKDGQKRISIILVAIPGTVYSAYLLLPNNVLRKFNYEESMYQEAAFCRDDYRESAILAVNKLNQLHEMNKMMNIHCTDIESDDNKWVFAEYYISDEQDKDNVVKFTNFINSIIETSIYEGCIESPTGEYRSHGFLAISEKSIYDTDINLEGVKFYKNPAKQLQIKNSRKRNDKIKIGNYAGSQKQAPKITTKKKPVKEQNELDIEKAAEDANKLLRQEIFNCKDCAYVYKDIMMPYNDDSSYAVIGWDLNKLKPGDASTFPKCRSSVFGYCKNKFNHTHPDYTLEQDDNCFYIYKK